MVVKSSVLDWKNEKSNVACGYWLFQPTKKTARRETPNSQEAKYFQVKTRDNTCKGGTVIVSLANPDFFRFHVPLRHNTNSWFFVHSAASITFSKLKPLHLNTIAYTSSYSGMPWGMMHFSVSPVRVGQKSFKSKA